MTLEERLDADLREAMRSGDTARKLAIRAVKTALSEAKVAGDEPRGLTEEEVLHIIQRQVKQRRDSIAQFTKGGRTDLVENEQAEIAILEQYLPAQLGEAEIRARAQAVMAELGATDQKAMGPVMKRLSSELRDQADFTLVSRVVRELLSSE